MRARSDGISKLIAFVAGFSRNSTKMDNYIKRMHAHIIFET